MPGSGKNAERNRAQLCSDFTGPIQQVSSAVDMYYQVASWRFRQGLMDFTLYKNLLQDRIEFHTSIQENVKLEGECQTEVDVISLRGCYFELIIHFHPLPRRCCSDSDISRRYFKISTWADVLRPWLCFFTYGCEIVADEHVTTLAKNIYRSLWRSKKTFCSQDVSSVNRFCFGASCHAVRDLCSKPFASRSRLLLLSSENSWAD